MPYQSHYGAPMKKTLFTILAMIPSIQIAHTYQPLHNLFHAETFNNHAIAWVNAYVFDRYGNRVATDMELQYVANLMLFSYLRSQETLTAQSTALEAIKSTWHGWQNIAKRRLNPSNQPPYTIDIEYELKKNELFWQSYARHQRVSSVYDHTVAQVVYGSLLETPLMVQGVKDMRTEARKIMLDALADIKRHLGNLFDYAFNKHFRNNQEVKRGIADFVLSYIPQLAVNTFIHADALHNTVSEETWHMLYTVQEVGIQTWQAIELARSAFYKAHYAYIYRTMQRLNINQPCSTVAFDEYGMIPAHAQNRMLPNPDTI